MDNLINRKQCKKFAVRWANENRQGWKPERVAKQFLDDLEAMLRIQIQKSVQHHPTIGKTIKYYF
jgi:hypothetical protein